MIRCYFDVCKCFLEIILLEKDFLLGLFIKEEFFLVSVLDND